MSSTLKVVSSVPGAPRGVEYPSILSRTSLAYNRFPTDKQLSFEPSMHRFSCFNRPKKVSQATGSLYWLSSFDQYYVHNDSAFLCQSDATPMLVQIEELSLQRKVSLNPQNKTSMFQKPASLTNLVVVKSRKYLLQEIPPGDLDGKVRATCTKLW